MTNAIDVIIVNWNTSTLLRKCLTSVACAVAAARVPVNIIVVDNASTDGSVEMVSREFDTVTVIKNESNIGFAKANNVGINSSSGGYVFLLNSDTEVEDNIFDDIVEQFEKNEKIAVIGCRLILPNGKRQVGDAGFRPTFFTGFSFAFFLSKISPVLFKGFFLNDRGNMVVDVDWVSGAALISRRDVLQHIGGVPDRFFMYAEDLELGLKVKEHGWRVCYCPNIQVIHHMGGSSQGNQKASGRWITNLLTFVKEKNAKFDYYGFCLSMGLGYFIRSSIYMLFFAFKKEESWRVKSISMYDASRNCFRHVLNSVTE